MPRAMGERDATEEWRLNGFKFFLEDDEKCSKIYCDDDCTTLWIPYYKPLDCTL